MGTTNEYPDQSIVNRLSGLKGKPGACWVVLWVLAVRNSVFSVTIQ
jgi:hypothetical protein